MKGPAPRPAVLVIGGRGEFGQFLLHDLLPALGGAVLPPVERDTPRDAEAALLAQARHVVLATPLSDYAAHACDLVHRCRGLDGPRTLWLIPSVQAGVWRAVTAAMARAAHPALSAVFAHPMYGPNGFRAHEREARTFRNILTATQAGARHPLDAEVRALRGAFWKTFHIATDASFDPEAHDRVTAYSQGLSYCVARRMFEAPALDAQVAARLPDLHHALHANHGLILDFLRLNAYMPQVQAAFDAAWRETDRSTVAALLEAFARTDASLNRGVPSPIPTKWYERLRAEALGRDGSASL